MSDLARVANTNYKKRVQPVPGLGQYLIRKAAAAAGVSYDEIVNRLRGEGIYMHLQVTPGDGCGLPSPLNAYLTSVQACCDGRRCLDRPGYDAGLSLHKHCENCGCDVKVVDENEGYPVYEDGAVADSTFSLGPVRCKDCAA